MIAKVGDIMSRKLVYVREGDRVEIALQPILDFGITAVPVLDEDDVPVGVVSLRDLVDPRRRGDRVQTPVAKIGQDATIPVAARALAEAAVHHLVVVDATGRAVGMVSAIDLVRALVGLEVTHPRALETFDREPAA